MTKEEKIKSIIAEQLCISPENLTSKKFLKEDLGMDSLDAVELVMVFEDNFNIEISDGDAEKIKTVGDIIKYIEYRTQPHRAHKQGAGE